MPGRGRIAAYEQPEGILARIFDYRGAVMGEGFGVVWSPAVLAAEINAGLIQGQVAQALGREGINSQEDIMLTARLQGYRQVLTAAALALVAVKKMGGRTLIKREGLGGASHFPGCPWEHHSRLPSLLLPNLRRSHRGGPDAHPGG